MSSSPGKSSNKNIRRSPSPKKQESNGGQSPYNEQQSDQDQMKYLYEQDQELVKLVQTQHQIYEKIESQPSKQELVYVSKFEQVRYTKRVEIKQITEKMTDSSKQHKGHQDDLIKNNSSLRDQLNQLRKQMASAQKSKLDEQVGFEDVLSQRNQRIQIVTQESLQLSIEKRYYEARLKIQSDVEKEIVMEKDQQKRLQDQKRILEQELQNASDYIHECEQRVEEATRRSLELLKQLKNAETEIETLKQYIIELKQRIAVYIPVRDDQIDKKLAEYINNYPERQKLKIMFMRESEGIYQFGTKRVYVRVDKDKINIRVGGGYLSIDEFLDQYTPAELEKLERKDPLKKFSEKVAVQKTLVGKELRESSPIRGSDSPTQSPVRSQKSPSRQSQQSPKRSSPQKSPKKLI